jgi:acetyltransferase-like isoleucine patch superfamily enzyme
MSPIYCDNTSQVNLGKNVSVSPDSVITSQNNSTLLIGDNVQIIGHRIYLSNGKFKIGHDSVFKKILHYSPNIAITNGSVEVGHHCIFHDNNWAIRFGGKLTIGDYSGLDSGSQIICDEEIRIGQFCMISSECIIWDTNTHQILPVEERRKIRKQFLWGNVEVDRPKTKPVYIGDDVWIGQRAVILKGSLLEDESIVGVAAVVPGAHVPKGFIAVGNPAKVIPQKTDQKVNHKHEHE